MINRIDKKYESQYFVSFRSRILNRVRQPIQHTSFTKGVMCGDINMLLVAQNAAGEKCSRVRQGVLKCHDQLMSIRFPSSADAVNLELPGIPDIFRIDFRCHFGFDVVHESRSFCGNTLCLRQTCPDRV